MLLISFRKLFFDFLSMIVEGERAKLSARALREPKRERVKPY